MRLDNGSLVWRESDNRVMGDLLGEHASKLRCPYNEGILKAAAKKGLTLSPVLQKELKNAEMWRTIAEELKKLDDYPAFKAKEELFFPHQRADVQYMREMGLPAYLLQHSPGVGKTLIAMWWAAYVRKSARTLVVTPNTAKDQWKREIRRWIGPDAKITVVEGRIPEQIKKASRARGWIVAHWEALVHAREGFLAKPWDVVILDEAHNIANRKAKRSETVFDLRADARLAVTAHPFANSEDELFPILRFLYPHKYSSFWRFMALHVETAPKFFGGFEVVGAQRPKLLRWEMAPFTIGRTKREVFKNLPPLTRVVRTLEMPKTMEREYERLKKELFVELETHDPDTPKILLVPSVLARITRLRQYLVDPGLLGAKQKSLKYPVVLELMEEMDGPPVIFTEFRQAAEALIKFLGGRGIKKKVGLVAGESTKSGKARRSAVQAAFFAGELDAVVMVAKVGSTALNYGKYGHLIHLDLPWNGRDLEQREGRVDRPEEGTGKMVPTTAYPVVIKGSYEERIMAKIEKRHGRFSTIFTPREMRRLFR